MVGAGYFLARRGLPGGGREALAAVAYTVALPALVLDELAGTTPDRLFTVELAAVLCGVLGAAALFLLYGALTGRGLTATVIGALASSYANVGNLGLPVATLVLGDPALAVGVMVFQLVVLAPVGLTVLDLRRPRAPGARGRRPVNPVVLAAGLGLTLLLTGAEPPPVLLAPVDLVAAAAIPLLVLVFGMSLHGGGRVLAAGDRGGILVASVLKVVVCPAIAAAVASLGGVSGTALLAPVLCAAFPAAQNVVLYASRYPTGPPGRWPTGEMVMARDTVVASTALALPVLLGVVLVLGP